MNRMLNTDPQAVNIATANTAVPVLVPYGANVARIYFESGMTSCTVSVKEAFDNGEFTTATPITYDIYGNTMPTSYTGDTRVEVFVSGVGKSSLNISTNQTQTKKCHVIFTS